MPSLKINSFFSLLTTNQMTPNHHHRRSTKLSSGIHHFSFNADGSCFCVGSEGGLSVFGSFPLKRLLLNENPVLRRGQRRQDEEEEKDSSAATATAAHSGVLKSVSAAAAAGLGCVALLDRSNILLLTSSTSKFSTIIRNPLFPPNKLVCWDDALKQQMFEIDFLSDICNVKVSRTR